MNPQPDFLDVSTPKLVQPIAPVEETMFSASSGAIFRPFLAVADNENPVPEILPTVLEPLAPVIVDDKILQTTAELLHPDPLLKPTLTFLAESQPTEAVEQLLQNADPNTLVLSSPPAILPPLSTNIPLPPFVPTDAPIDESTTPIAQITDPLVATNAVQESLNAPLTGKLGGVFLPGGTVAPPALGVVLPPLNSAPAMALIFPATRRAYIDEFYAQLKVLHGFFAMTGIKYWLTGGSLLGQHREKRFLQWGDSNAIGIMENDGPMVFYKLRAYLKAKLPTYDLWNSVHGLKLINKSMKGVATDIYYYKLNGPMYVLASDRSRKQWPRDNFVPQDLAAVQIAQYGDLNLIVPQNPQSYLASIYGPRFMNFARLSSYDHFANAGRRLPIVEVALSEIILQQ